MLYLCHQCFGKTKIEDVAHVDMYVDLCWIQCEVCAAAFGPACGADPKTNPRPHGYFSCPYRLDRDMVGGSKRPRLHLVGELADEAG